MVAMVGGHPRTGYLCNSGPSGCRFADGGTVHRNFLVDFRLTTPKQDARSLTKYAKRHPELSFSTFVVPQVPGSIPRSKPTDGVLESLVKSKKYAAPLVWLSPELVAGMVSVYLVYGRFQPPAHDPVVTVPLPAQTNAILPASTRPVLPTPSETDAIAVHE
jgi:hypothetical protein